MWVSVESAWKDFLEEGDQAARGLLIEHYHPLVTRVARKVGRRLPARVEPEDLVSWGTLGLIDALDRFDPELGKFEAFAAPRIRGSILDEIRGMDWVPRSVRARDRQVRDAAAELQATHGRTATTRQIAAHLGMEPHKVDRVDDVWHSLDEPDRDGLLACDMVGDRSESVESQIMVTDIRRRASSAVADLDQRSRHLIALYYLGGHTLNEVGATFGVTESRVCQIQGAALSNFGQAFVVH